MKEFKNIIIEEGEGEFDFICFENDYPINIGDKFIYFFGGIASVQVCDSESVRLEINKHDRPKNENIIDLVHGFWKSCHLIKETNFDLNLIY